MLLRAFASLAPHDVAIDFYDTLGELPQFNPDVDDAGAPPVVLDLRERLTRADAVVISTPEYAHGLPGSLKNALDWVVGSGEIVDKRISILNPSPRSTFAQAQLIEILTVMSGVIVNDACVTMQIRGKYPNAEAIVADEELAAPLRDAMRVIASR